MATFLLIYFGVYGSMHAYLYWKAFRAFSFGWKAGAALALLMLLQMLAPILVRFCERAGWERTARFLAWEGYTWLALVFLFLSFGLGVDLLRVLLGLLRAALHGAPGFAISHAWAFGLPLALSAAVMVYGLWEASVPRVERLALKSPKLPAGSVVRIAQISDLHLGLLVRERYLGRVVDLLVREKPDLLVSTGDLVDGEMNHLDGLSERLAAVRPPLGKFAVVGNHEVYAGLDQALDFTRRCGFAVLRGETADVGDLLVVAGVDDEHAARFAGGRGKGEGQLLEGLAQDRFVLFLKHRPPIKEAPARRFDLQLSGHTHGGQIFPFSIPVNLAYHYPAGLAPLPGGGSLYTSRGTGTWGPPMRVLNPPEITLIEVVGTGP